ncbi:MAG: helix-turn-helix transcriptional regulator [Cyanobacteria bacterium P01_D01_bin.116]
MLASANSKKEVFMIDVQHIATLKWTQEQASKLLYLRGKMSRRELAEKTEQLGTGIARQYIQQLEQPHMFIKRIKSDYLTVSVEVVQVLCQALEVDITDFFNSAKFFSFKA